MKLSWALSGLVLLLFSRCTLQRHQILTYVPTHPQAKILADQVYLDDGRLGIGVDLWNNEADLMLYNRTAQALVVDLTQSFSILDHYAMPYFQNKTYVNVERTTWGRVSSYQLSRYRNVGYTSAYTSENGTFKGQIPEVVIPAGSFVRLAGPYILAQAASLCRQRTPDGKRTWTMPESYRILEFEVAYRTDSLPTQRLRLPMALQSVDEVNPNSFYKQQPVTVCGQPTYQMQRVPTLYSPVKLHYMYMR